MFEKFGWSVTNQWVRNEEVLIRAGIEIELASTADQRALRWFGHVGRMDEYRMAGSKMYRLGGELNRVVC